MNNHFFTVITVCLNASAYISRTVNSVMRQSCTDFEYIIKDGGSIDGTLDIVRELTGDDERVKIISEPDSGIYDAMNSALSQAEGKYIIFMNAGDGFSEKDVLMNVRENILAFKPGFDIYYGDVIEVSNDENLSEHVRIYSEKNSRMWYYSLGACLCHQTMFCRAELFSEKQFDLDFRVCADKEWQMYHLKNKASACCLHMVVAKVLMQGFSSSNIALLEKETKRCVDMYCSVFSRLLYRIIGVLKKNRSVHAMLTGAEARVSTRKEV